MKPDYTPISCSAYDVLESSAVKQTTMRIDFVDTAGKTQSKTVRIHDLFSKDKIEFLIARDAESGEEITLRLDKIVLITDLATKTAYTPTAC